MRELNYSVLVFMKLNIRNKLAVLLALAAIVFIAVSATDDLAAAECQYRYYYVSLAFTDEFKKGKIYNKAKIRIMEMRVFDADIYDLPNLPSSWVYDISNNGDVAFMSAAASSDNQTIKYGDLGNFVILRQPANKPEEKLHIKLTILYMMQNGIHIDISDTDYDSFTVQKIEKCLPEKPRRR